MIHLPDKRIAVTGGDGFLGRHVVQNLWNRGCLQVTIPLIRQYDLTKEAYVEQLYADARPKIVIHLVAQPASMGQSRAPAGAEKHYSVLFFGKGVET
jgi:GDP-L-fucose synthase